MIGPNLFHCLSYFRSGILDNMAFIQYAIVEVNPSEFVLVVILESSKYLDIVPENIIGSNDNIMLRKLFS